MRFVNATEPYASIEVEMAHVPQIGETVIVRGTLREVVDVVTSISVDRWGIEGKVMGTTVMTQDRASCWPGSPF